jgi:23S rRNA-/tRNA-specific pseudouridylate synthase
VQKTYWAVVQGRVSEADLTGGRLAGRGIHPVRVEADDHWWLRLEMPIRRDPRHRVRMTANAPRTFVHHPGNRFAPEEPERAAGRSARTDFRVLQCWKDYTLLEVRIATGRTHQIRVHLSAVGHPVAGDRLYGAAALPPGMLPPEPGQPQVQQAAETRVRRPEPCATGAPEPNATEPGVQRFYLHARRIALMHPVTHAPLSIEAPLPPDFEKLLQSLGV